MAYREYRKSGRTLGKVLYQLHTIGIPLRIVEMVTVGDNVIKYGNEVFATFDWFYGDVPIFKFKLMTYNLVQDAFLKKASYEEGSEFTIKPSVNHIHSGKTGKLKKTTKVSSINALLDFGGTKFYLLQMSDIEPKNIQLV